MTKCIFCGKEVKNKTKEHILPKWLLKITGDPNRTVSFGYNYAEVLNGNLESIRKFSFSSFTFPACYECNNNYGNQLEILSNEIIIKILNGTDVNNMELSILLDWFDKIRISLWVGFNLLHKDISNISPRFYINTRIRKKDRALLVYKIAEKSLGLTFSGYTPLFGAYPCCFYLRINNYLFINISIENFLLGKLGFPSPYNGTIQKDGSILYEGIKYGHNRIDPSLLNLYSFNNYQRAIFQPIFTLYPSICSLDIEYLNNNSLDKINGISDVFVLDNNIICNIKELNNKYNLNSKLINIPKVGVGYHILKTLEMLHNDHISQKFCSQKFKRAFVLSSKFAIEFNHSLLKQLENST